MGSRALRSVVRHLPDAIALAALDGTITWVNPVGCRVFAVGEAGGPLGAIVGDPDRAALGRAVSAALCGGGPHEVVVRPSGDASPHTVSVVDLGEEVDGARLLVIARVAPVAPASDDIEQRYRRLAETSPEAVFIDVGGRVEFANRAGAALYGADSPARLVGMEVADLVPLEDRAQVAARLHRVGDDGELAAVAEERILRFDGTIRDVEVASSPVTFGGRSGVMVILRDVSDRKRAAARLAESEERFRRVYEASPVGIVLSDPAGRVQHANDAVCRLLGVELRELQQRLVGELAIDPTRRGPVAAERTLPHRDGSDVPVSITSVEIPETDGSIGVWSIVQDIGPLKRREAELRDAVAAAQAANAAKSQFLSRMSHELRTPMNAVLGFAQLLAMAELEPQEQESVSHILVAGEHLLNLIDEVLDISRIEQGRIEVELDSVGLGPIVEECVTLSNGLAGEASVELRVEPSVASMVVRADAHRLRQVVLNLLSNAIKYNVPEGSVTIGAEPGDGVVGLWVADEGPGIAPEDTDRLFQPFERLDAAARGIAGTGIGLALCQRLVELMCGRIEVHSRLGEGSRFTVWLPSP